MHVHTCITHILRRRTYTNIFSLRERAREREREREREMTCKKHADNKLRSLPTSKSGKRQLPDFVIGKFCPDFQRRTQKRPFSAYRPSLLCAVGQSIFPSKARVVPLPSAAFSAVYTAVKSGTTSKRFPPSTSAESSPSQQFWPRLCHTWHGPGSALSRRL